MFVTVIIRVLGVPIVPFTINVCLPFSLDTNVVTNNVMHVFIRGGGNARTRGGTHASENLLFASNVVTKRNVVNVLLTMFTMIGVSSGVVLPFRLPRINDLILCVTLLMLLCIMYVGTSGRGWFGRGRERWGLS